jgi:hypothetical protein
MTDYQEVHLDALEGPCLYEEAEISKHSLVLIFPAVVEVIDHIFRRKQVERSKPFNKVYQS